MMKNFQVDIRYLNTEDGGLMNKSGLMTQECSKRLKGLRENISILSDVHFEIRERVSS